MVSREMNLHERVYNELRDQILDGRFAPGVQLPPELTLVEQHGVSRGTIRQAMNALVHAGLIERIPGRGTFVRTQTLTLAPPIERRIGVILPYLGDELAANILLGVESAGKMRGYQLSFAHSDERAEQQTADIKRLCADHVAGLILYPVSNQSYDDTIWQLVDDQLPLVLIDRYYRDLATDVVTIANRDGSYRATEHLILQGQRRIGFITPNQATTTTSVQDRYAGYCDAMRDYGLPLTPEWVYHRGALTASTPKEHYYAYLQNPDRPDAVVAVNDFEAIALIQAAAACGIPVPEQLAVVGFDGVILGQHLYAPLTTLVQPSHEIGVRAAHLLIDRIEGYRGPTRHVELPVSLVIRESCGARRRLRQMTEDSTMVIS